MIEIKDAPNISMDVRRKQRPSYQTGFLTLGLRGCRFRPRHLNRYIASLVKARM
jgi:hypothetical protein